MRHATRLPGEQVADGYLDRMQRQAEATGVVLVAERDNTFIGFVAGWVERTDNIGETADSNRFGTISDICIMPAFVDSKSPGNCSTGSNNIFAALASRVCASTRSR